MTRLIKYSKIPFIRLLPPLIAGIMIQELLPGLNLLSVLFPTTLLSFACWLIPYKSDFLFRMRGLFGIAAFLALMCLGAFSVVLQQPHEVSFSNERQVYTCRITDNPSDKGEYLSAKGTLLKINESGGAAENLNLPVIINISKDDTTCTGISTGAGQIIMCSGNIRNIRSRGNPGEFDYSTYIRRKGFCHTIYTSQSRVRPIQSGLRAPLHKRIRNSIISAIDNCNLSILQRSMIKAMTIGYREEVPQEVRQSFSDCGVSHILAVSGLHTGIIYLIITWLMLPLRYAGAFRIFHVISLLCLWSYALIAGMPASVVRAVTMITIMLTGKILDRKSNPLNTLFATAFLMLLADPFSLFDAGFQLSFFSVLSILIFYPWLNKKIVFKSWLPGYLWNLASLSISAQILILPLIIYYYNQIPVWFLISNILIVPLLMPYTMGCILMIALKMMGIEPAFLSSSIGWLSDFIVNLSAALTKLPGTFLLSDIYLSVPGCIMLMGMIASVALVIYKPKAVNVNSMLSILLVATLYSCYRESERFSAIAIFNDSREDAVHLFSRNISRTCTSGHSSEISPRKEFCNLYNVATPQIINSDSITEGIERNGDFFRFGGLRFVMLTDDSLCAIMGGKPIECDYAILGGGFRSSLARVSNIITADTIILMPSLPAYIRRRLNEESSATDVALIDISASGAFIRSLK